MEGRNTTFERWGLKRLSVYGNPRSRATIFQADVWYNLTTLARLIREASAAAGRRQQGAAQPSLHLAKNHLAGCVASCLDSVTEPLPRTFAALR